MNTDFAAAMRRALDLTRAGNPGQATAAIQAGLSSGNHAGTDLQVPPEILPPSKNQTRFSVIDPKADPDVNDEMGNMRHPSPRKRRPLREVLETLRSGRISNLGRGLPAMLSRPAAVSPEIPGGASYLTRSFTCDAGTRSYKLYIPADLPKEPQGIVIMLHGCTQDPDDFAIGTGMNALAETHGLLIAYPAQTRSDNASACWNWFRPGDQGRDRGEPAIIAGMTRSLIAEFDIDPARVFVAGLSAGGAMAAVMGDAYPDLFTAVGVHAGLASGSASDVVSAFAAMRGDGERLDDIASGPAVRTIVFHGLADGTVHPSNADRIVARAGRGLDDVEQETGHSAGGRSFSRMTWRAADGSPAVALWLIEGAGHAWAGGKAAGSFTDPAGPDASAEMICFFFNAS